MDSSRQPGKLNRPLSLFFLWKTARGDCTVLVSSKFCTPCSQPRSPLRRVSGRLFGERGLFFRVKRCTIFSIYFADFYGSACAFSRVKIFLVNTTNVFSLRKNAICDACLPDIIRVQDDFVWQSRPFCAIPTVCAVWRFWNPPPVLQSPCLVPWYNVYYVRMYTCSTAPDVRSVLLWSCHATDLAMA